MELDELKATWKQEKKALENRIKLDEAYIQKFAFDKSKGVFDRLMTTAIMGRNLALVYMLISFTALYFMQAELWQSTLVFISGLAMLFSFFQHRSLKKPAYSLMNTVELQKAIAQFRIHTAKHAKYDLGIVALWFSAMIPVYLKLFSNQSINFVDQLLVSAAIVVLMVVLSPFIYGRYNRQLAENEAQLAKVIEFESLD
ncbi:MAG: hypothetical protein R8G66_31825 [Cytophagales bacterium]|nr:hypothetical protein [Cytophagales bacterium]